MQAKSAATTTRCDGIRETAMQDLLPGSHALVEPNCGLYRLPHSVSTRMRCLKLGSCAPSPRTEEAQRGIKQWRDSNVT